MLQRHLNPHRRQLHCKQACSVRHFYCLAPCRVDVIADVLVADAARVPLCGSDALHALVHDLRGAAAQQHVTLHLSQAHATAVSAPRRGLMRGAIRQASHTACVAFFFGQVMQPLIPARRNKYFFL